MNWLWTVVLEKSNKIWSAYSYKDKIVQSPYFAIAISYSLVEFLSFYNKEIVSRFQNSTLCSNGACCVYVISSDHAHSDSSPLALSDSFRNLKYTQKKSAYAGSQLKFIFYYRQKAKEYAKFKKWIYYLIQVLHT